MLGCRSKTVVLFSGLGRGLSSRKQGKSARRLLAWSSALLGKFEGVAVCWDAQKGLGMPRHVLFKTGCKALQPTKAAEHRHKAAALAQPHLGGGGRARARAWESRARAQTECNFCRHSAKATKPRLKL